MSEQKTLTAKDIHIKEEYYDLVPRPSKEERQMLKESIQIHGQREPIIVNEMGEILDGHTRWEICLELGREPLFIVRKMGDLEHERIYVIDANLARRQLGLFQKFELVYALYCKEKIRGERRVNGIRLKNNTDNAKTFGRQIGMSRDYFFRCQYLFNHADNKMLTLLRSNKISIQVAYQKLRKPQPSKIRINGNSFVRCPSCNTEFKRKNLVVVKR